MDQKQSDTTRRPFSIITAIKRLNLHWLFSDCENLSIILTVDSE